MHPKLSGWVSQSQDTKWATGVVPVQDDPYSMITAPQYLPSDELVSPVTDTSDEKQSTLSPSR